MEGPINGHVHGCVHPRRMGSGRDEERAKQVYVTSGVLFSAGVLLAGGFVHLLNDR